jgi:hypothetical protein
MKRRGLLPLFFAAFFLSIFSAWAQTITVTNPIATDVWIKGQTYAIKWTPSGTMPATVRIVLRNPEGTSTIQVIADSAPNSKTYSWTIPDSVADGSYKIRVRATGTAIEGYSALFQVKSSGSGSPGFRAQMATAKVADEIEITRPAEDDSFIPGQGVRIHWNMRQPLGGSVRIILLDPGDSTVQMIAASTKNKGTFDWVIPENTAIGSYRIKVESLELKVLDKSGMFKITEKPVIGRSQVTPKLADELKKTEGSQAVVAIFRVISPTQDQIIQPPKQPIHVVWETPYPSPFSITLLKQIPGYDSFVEAKSLCEEMHFNPQSGSGDLKRYGCDFYIDLDDTAVPDGWCKVRVSYPQGPSTAHGTSPSFRIERGTVQKQVVLEPDEIVDRFTDWTKYYTYAEPPKVGSTVRQGHESKPGLARVGYCFVFTSEGQITSQAGWDKHLDIFRSKVRFPLSAYKKSAGVKISKATLRLVSQASDIAPILQQTTHACGNNLYFLAKPWDLGEGNCLNASGVLLAALPNQTECFIDVTESVKHVCEGGLPNYGFLLTGLLEQMPGDKDIVSRWCITWYKAVLILDYEQNL